MSNDMRKNADFAAAGRKEFGEYERMAARFHREYTDQGMDFGDRASSADSLVNVDEQVDGDDDEFIANVLSAMQ